MAYTDDGVLAKLSALNETQESIVTVAQWVMFHRYARVTSFSWNSNDRLFCAVVNSCELTVAQATCRAHCAAMVPEAQGLGG